MRAFSRRAAYILALAGVVLALVARILMNPVLGEDLPYVTFFIAVTCAAVLGGLGTGIVSTLIGALAAAYFFVPPLNSLWIDGAANRLGFAMYVVVCSTILLLSRMQRSARTRAERSAKVAENNRLALETEMRLREKAEADERRARKWLDGTISNIGDAVIATDVEARIIFINQVAADLTGWTASDAIGRPIETVLSIGNEQPVVTVDDLVRRAIREGRVTGLGEQTVLLSKREIRVPVEHSAAPMIDAGGNVIGAVLVLRDVREMRTREAELRLRKRMIDLAHDAIITTDGERRITGWNVGAEEIYGWTAEEAAGKVLNRLLQTQNSKAIEMIDKELRRDGQWDGELVQTCKQGQKIVSHSRQVLLHDEGGEIAGILEINRDVTDRKRVEEQLRGVAAEAEEGRRMLEAVMEHIPEGLTIADAPDVRVRMVSRHGAELAGQPREAMENTCANEHVTKWGIYCADGETQPRPEELPLTRAVVNGEISTNEEWMIKRPDGEAVWILCNAAPIRDRDGRVTGGLIAWRDVTQRRRLEQKLRETAKLESLGVLAGGIAHDFNNLLTGVLGNASVMSSK